MKYAKIALIFVAAVISAVACAQNQPSSNTAKNVNTVEPQPSKTVDELAAGRKIFRDNCVKCHKEDGTGGKLEIEGKTIKAENFTSEHAKKESDEEFIEHINDGILDEGMPSFKETLSEEEIKTVVKYIRAEIQK